MGAPHGPRAHVAASCRCRTHSVAPLIVLSRARCGTPRRSRVHGVVPLVFLLRAQSGAPHGPRAYCSLLSLSGTQCGARHRTLARTLWRPSSSSRAWCGAPCLPLVCTIWRLLSSSRAQCSALCRPRPDTYRTRTISTGVEPAGRAEKATAYKTQGTGSRAYGMRALLHVGICART